jgi:hypothetical protein
MAITGIGISTGTYVPYTAPTREDRTKYELRGTHILHQIDLNFQKIDEREYIKWCRRNLGERGQSWDFWLAGGILYIEVWGEKEKFTYEMWKN